LGLSCLVDLEGYAGLLSNSRAALRELAFM
jgi:hypothetical protein